MRYNSASADVFAEIEKASKNAKLILSVSYSPDLPNGYSPNFTNSLGIHYSFAQSAGAVEYTDCTSAEG